MTGNAKRVLLIDDDVLAVTELRQKLLSSQQIHICGEVSRVEDLWQVIHGSQPDVIVVGSLQGMEIGVLCQQIRFYCPHVTFIAACSAREMHWEPFLRNLGIWIIAKPVLPSQLEMLCAQIAPANYLAMTGASFPPPEIPAIAERQEPPYAPKPNSSQYLITVYGPKGGVGKTFLSRELAIYFALGKKEGRPLKVLAVDFNLDLGTFATSLNLPRTPNLFTWVQAIDEQLMTVIEREGKQAGSLSHGEWQEYSSALRFAPEDVKRYIVTHEQSGLHVLTSPREIRQSFEIKDYHLYVMLETLKLSDYDVILIDTAPDTSDATIQALFFAHKVVMVGNPVVDAIENIQRMLKLLREAEYPEERIQICINRLQRKEMFTVEEMRAYFQLHPSKTVHTVPDDSEVKRSINSGVPLMLHPGKIAAKTAIESLANALIPLAVGQETHADKQKGKSRQSLFQWLRK